jgi:anthranilate synthase component 2
MILMIDNYDSFTYNIVQYLAELGASVEVFRNDEIDLAQIEALAPEKIIISPGPCTPKEAGISISVVEHFKGVIPIFGVCLGHQTIGDVFGGNVIRAREVMHGKVSPVYHNEKGVFDGLPQGFNVTRYHSLVVDKASLPECLEITAWTQTPDGAMDEIMGLRHKEFDIEGVQYHPESILSEHGHAQLKKFIERSL